MSLSESISVPIKFNQLVELVKTLPQKQKSKLMVVLGNDMHSEIPEWQKKEVNKRIKKYAKNPELLISETDGLKMIKEF